MVRRTELLFHATKHFEVKKWVRSKKRREDVTYQALLQYAKEHEMTVKDFNHHKSNGGIAQPTTVDAIKTFKQNGKKSSTKTSGSHRTSGQSTRAVSATLRINLKTVRRLARNAINVALKTILARVADHHVATETTQTDGEVEHHHVVEGPRDVTDPAETDAPGPGHDQEAVHRPGMPTASKLTGMISTTLTF